MSYWRYPVLLPLARARPRALASAIWKLLLLLFRDDRASEWAEASKENFPLATAVSSPALASGAAFFVPFASLAPLAAPLTAEAELADLASALW